VCSGRQRALRPSLEPIYESESEESESEESESENSEPEPEHEPERRADTNGFMYTKAVFDAYYCDDSAAWRAVPLYADLDPDELEDSDSPPPSIETRRPAGQGAKARRAAARAATFGTDTS
jgi:hypothetical protein